MGKSVTRQRAACSVQQLVPSLVVPRLSSCGTYTVCFMYIAVYNGCHVLFEYVMCRFLEC